MTRPGGELTTYCARGGHATDWANLTRLASQEGCHCIAMTNGGEHARNRNSDRHDITVTSLSLTEEFFDDLSVIGHIKDSAFIEISNENKVYSSSVGQDLSRFFQEKMIVYMIEKAYL